MSNAGSSQIMGSVGVLAEEDGCWIQGLWGARSEGPAAGADLLRKTAKALEGFGGLLAGPWGVSKGDTFEKSRIVSIQDMSDDELIELVQAGLNELYPESGYSPTIYRGFVKGSSKWETIEGATVSCAIQVKSIWFRRNAFNMSTDALGRAIGVANEMWKNAELLVEVFASIWRPDSMSFFDQRLVSLRPGRRNKDGSWNDLVWPFWGYVSYLSETVAGSLGDQVDGASVRRFGSGVIFKTDSTDAEEVARLWQGLQDQGRISPIPDVQKREPVFPSLNG